MLLTTKSILDCNEYDEELHSEEIQEIMDRLFDLPNYNCAVIYRYIDIAHKGKEDVIKGCKLHDCFEMIEYADIKNGIDLMLNDDGLLTFIAHGQGYTYNDEYGLVTTAIVIMPYDENKNSIDISYLFTSEIYAEDCSLVMN